MVKSPLSVPRFRIIFSISWLVVMTDIAFLLNWYGWPWNVAIIDSSISTIILLLACLLMMNTLRFYTPGRERYFNILIWCLFLTGVWLLISRWLLKLSLGHYENYSPFLSHSLIIRSSIGFLLLGCVTLISVLWFNWGEQKENEKRNADGEKLAKEAELFKLRQQLQPHFLFNSLNSINALIGARPEEARKMVQQLSDFLRGTIKKEETQWVILREELQYLQLYLDIEKVRFGNRLNTIIETNDATNQMKLPALLLQPIVENAIKFGLYDTTGETVIRIYADKDGNDLVIKVLNPFDPETSSPNQGTGFGLKSVQRRLYLLFARNDLLSTEAKENIFTTVVKIPQATGV
jgi:hypothetical protein